MIYSIRGATTANNDIASILQASQELYETILINNHIDSKTINTVFVSTTLDLRATYAAKGVRNSKLYDINTCIFSTCEPPIDGALSGCIRLLVQGDTNIVNSNPNDNEQGQNTEIKSSVKPQHIYLKGAKILRPDINRINIALDGPSGAGKSTLAKMLSKELSITYLDTGALYRAVGLLLVNHNAFIKDKIVIRDDELAELLKQHTINTSNDVDGTQSVFIDGIDVSMEIRQHKMSFVASTASANSVVREYLLGTQRQIAQTTSCVLDGRDIGTVVLPNADYKFFIIANVETRAKRRVAQLASKGEIVDIEQVKQDIVARDYNDSNRAIAPLIKPEDAIVIDTTGVTAEQSILQIMQYINGKKD